MEGKVTGHFLHPLFVYFVNIFIFSMLIIFMFFVNKTICIMLIQVVNLFRFHCTCILTNDFCFSIYFKMVGHNSFSQSFRNISSNDTFDISITENEAFVPDFKSEIHLTMA